MVVASESRGRPEWGVTRKAGYALFLAFALPFSLLLLLPVFDDSGTVAKSQKTPFSEVPVAAHETVMPNGSAFMEAVPHFSPEGEQSLLGFDTWKTIRFSYDERLNEVLHSSLYYLRAAFLKNHDTLYPYPALPKVAFVLAEELSEKVCRGECLVRGWFPAGNVIYLDNSLRVLTSLEHRSILLHELVHYFQYASRMAPEVPGEPTASTVAACEAWLSREAEAYAIQYAWLAEEHAGKFMPSSRYEITGDCSGYAERRD